MIKISLICTIMTQACNMLYYLKGLNDFNV